MAREGKHLANGVFGGIETIDLRCPAVTPMDFVHARRGGQLPRETRRRRAGNRPLFYPRSRLSSSTRVYSEDLARLAEVFAPARQEGQICSRELADYPSRG